MPKEIWLPKGETKVTVHDGRVTVWEEMQMTPRPVQAPVGFSREPASDSTSAADGASISG